MDKKNEAYWTNVDCSQTHQSSFNCIINFFPLNLKSKPVSPSQPILNLNLYLLQKLAKYT